MVKQANVCMVSNTMHLLYNVYNAYMVYLLALPIDKYMHVWYHYNRQEDINTSTNERKD